MRIKRPYGFTIVELVVVIAVIGILAGIVAINYAPWQLSLAENAVKSDLLNVATSLENEKNFGSGYPSTFPSSFQPSDNVILEMTTTAAGKFCINGYHTKYPAIRMSISSDQKNTVREYLCSGGSTGVVAGGTIPDSPTGVNIAPSFDDWTLTGTASYNSSTGELTMGTNGTATSPLVRVNGSASVALNAKYYATVQSAQTSLQPYGGWHSHGGYYAADGTTAATNSGGYVGNGCARKVTLGSWNLSQNGTCAYATGPNVTYAKVTFYSAASGYASTDLKIKDVSLVLN
jgi:prepilin-type N-terminal cleavage/methylation domain-containing protein